MNIKEIKDQINNIPKEKWDKFFALIPDMEVAESYGELSKDTNALWYDHSELYGRYYKLFYETGLYIDFNWPEWGHGKTIPNDPDKLKNESLEHLVMLLTAILRNDRFCEGTLLVALESKFILNIMKAMKGKVE